MAKPEPKVKRIEISKTKSETPYFAYKVYAEKENGEWFFTDLRTEVDYNQLKNIDEYDFTKCEKSSLERLIYYKLTKATIDLDYCISVRTKNYDFRLMSDLYSVLWDIKMDDEVINSADTLVSAELNILRCRNEVKRKQGKGIDWNALKNNAQDEDLETFAKAVAIIGNFMPVPAKHQSLLSYMDERFDMVLHLVKAFYYDKDYNISTTFMFSSLEKWLMKFWDENGEKSWKRFVDRNYLCGSFVDENYNVVNYDGTLTQLSTFIYNRSVVMIEEYESRVEKRGSKS